jgi:hypothetical protein
LNQRRYKLLARAHRENKVKSHVPAFRYKKKENYGGGGVTFVLGFQAIAKAPPTIDNIPPGTVTMPMSEIIPSISITMPHAFAEPGLLLIIIPPMMIIIPNIARIHKTTPACARVRKTPNNNPPRRTSIPPIKDSMNAVRGLSSIFPP